MASIENSIWNIKREGANLEEIRADLQNGESELFLLNGKLYKIIERDLCQNKQLVMEYLYNKPHNLPINIYELLYEDENFVGYVMEYYKEYQTLYEFLKSDGTLEERKKVCKELIKINLEFRRLKMIYFDWHSKNAMYNGDMKILDVDSAKQTTDLNYDVKSRFNLFMLCLSILNGIDFDWDLNLIGIRRDDLLSSLFPSEEVSCRQLIDFDFMEKEIDSYTNTKVDSQREIILKYK